MRAPDTSQLLRAFLVAAALSRTVPAVASEVLILDITDDDAREGLRARADLLKAVGRISGVSIAPLSKLKKLARAEHLDFDLSNVRAIESLSRLAHLTAILGATIDERNGRRVLHLTGCGPNGSLLYHRNLDLAVGQLLPDDAETLTDDLTAALGIHASDPPRRQVVTPTLAVAPSPPVVAPAPVLAPSHPAVAPDLVPAHPVAPAPVLAFPEPLLQFELGARASTTTTSLTNNGPISSCAPNCSNNLRATLYPGIAARLQTFPFHRSGDWLAGAGIIAAASFGLLKLAGPTPAATASARDLRLSADAVYRRRLGFLVDTLGIYSPSLGLRVGFQLRDFDMPASTSLHPLDRLGATLGAEILEPIGRHFRLVLGGALSFSPTPGTQIERALQSTQTLSDGFEFGLELQARLGRSGLIGAIRIGFGEFDDCFELAGSRGCNFSGRQASADAAVSIGYALY